jgi:hypothetical protein
VHVFPRSEFEASALPVGAIQMDDAGKTVLFLLIVFSLGTCLVAALWEIEQARARLRGRKADKARIARLATFRDPIP